jgi:hypothetical protein
MLPLDALANEAACATACLAPALGAGSLGGGRWAQTVWQSIGTAPDGTPRLWPALRLRRLSPMQRPQLARCWVDAVDTELWRHDAVADALVLVCRLLDTPLPPALAQRRLRPADGSVDGWTDPSTARSIPSVNSQSRSL